MGGRLRDERNLGDLSPRQLAAIVGGLIEDGRRQAAQIEQLTAREADHTAQIVELHSRLGASRRLRRRPVILALIGLLVVLLAAFPLVALAVDIFGDVPAGAQFHDDIEAIALAGITTGCTATTPPNYCPDDSVTRRAMAAFMHRGFTRVHQAETTSSANVTLTHSFRSSNNGVVTPGLPAAPLTGAAGFVKADAIVTITTDASDTCPCKYSIELRSNNQRFNGTGTAPNITLPAAGSGSVVAIGVLQVTTNQMPSIDVRIVRSGGTLSYSANFLLVSSYVPFGGAGSNVL